MKKVCQKALFSLIALAITLVLLTTVSLAYFSLVLDKVGVNSVMVELIFDHLDFNDPEIQAAGYAATDANGNDIPWGSERNPYVISQKYHIQNLSVLQNVGFFAERTETDAEGNEIPAQSYFLVCTPKGEPVVIDCQGMEIAPVGTHDLPFTGVVDGAPFEGKATWGGYGVSTSTIANLTVQAKSDVPDVGFFGYVGYYGNYDANTATLTDGYAARVNNLLFADVTVASSYTLLDALQDWWNRFTGHQNYVENREETHHVGIIAGHAEFATMTNLSVYYSEDVPAFALFSASDGSNTNYYSSTGLIGLLKYVNPVLKDDGTLDGSGGVSDADVTGDGSEGGGGEESGTLTGYMLAESLFSQHEEYLVAQSLATADKYDVRDMKDADGNALFQTVSMRERDGILDFTTEQYDYYYFQDTVFTFAMSASSKDTSRTDYVQKIWKLEQQTPVIYGAAEGKLHYGDDIGSSARIAYKLEAVSSMTEGGYYVLAHYDANAQTLYLFNLTKATTADNMFALASAEIYLGDEENGTKEMLFYDDAKTLLQSIYLIGTNKTYYEYAFRYDSASAAFVNPADGNKLGLTAGTNESGVYAQASAYYGDAEVKTSSSWLDSSVTAYYYTWAFNSVGNGRFTVHSSYSFARGSILARTYTNGWAKLKLANNEVGFDYGVSDTTNSAQTVTPEFAEENYFTVLKLSTNTVDEDGNVTSTNDNLELTPKNIVPETKTNEDGSTSLDTLYEFDPSTHVFEYNSETGTYKLAPIRSYRLNNGKGDLLTQLNHIVKLSKATADNYSLNLFDQDSFLSFINTNSGGVVGASIGTEGQYATIPAGMIAFEIKEASVENPSYINIIVAVNPEQVANGMVGIWQFSDSYAESFSLDSPLQSFMLPTSKTATSWESDSGRILTVSERVAARQVGEKTEYYTVMNGEENEVSQVYLGGDVALVYHSFSITEPAIYFIGAKDGPLSVSYFSVTGAAGAGDDGASGSPLGSVDFVYDFQGDIVTVDKPFEGEQLLSDEDYTYYYPSYMFLGMLPEKTDGVIQKIQSEQIVIRRYIDQSDQVGTQRHLSVTGQTLAAARVTSEFAEDLADDLET